MKTIVIISLSLFNIVPSWVNNNYKVMPKMGKSYVETKMKLNYDIELYYWFQMPD